MPGFGLFLLDDVFSEVSEGEIKRIKFRNVPTRTDLDTENMLKSLTTKIPKHPRRMGSLSAAGDVVQNLGAKRASSFVQGLYVGVDPR